MYVLFCSLYSTRKIKSYTPFFITYYYCLVITWSLALCGGYFNISCSTASMPRLRTTNMFPYEKLLHTSQSLSQFKQKIAGPSKTPKMARAHEILL